MGSFREGRSTPRAEPVRACPLCEEAASEELWTLPDRLYGVPGAYRYVRCTGCGSVYQSPRVRSEDLHLCYPSGYYTHSEEEGKGEEGEEGKWEEGEEGEEAKEGEEGEEGEEGGAGGEGGESEETDPAQAGGAGVMERPRAGEPGLRGLRDRIRSWIRWAVQGSEGGGGTSPLRAAQGDGWAGETARPGVLGRLVGVALSRSRAMRERAFYGLIDPVIPRSPAPGRALEIGTGSGWELSLLRRMGWEAEGVEFDSSAAEAAARDHGLSVRVGDFLEVVDEDERYDLIYLSHVFEHLPDLDVALRFLALHLRPGGRIVLVFPNLHSLGVRTWGHNWQGWDPPRHLVLPSHDGIRELARRTGLGARIGTRARGATFIHAASRAIAERFDDPGRGSNSERPSDPLNPRRGAYDRVRALYEGILVALGLPLGEETVVVLEVPE